MHRPTQIGSGIGHAIGNVLQYGELRPGEAEGLQLGIQAGEQ